MNQSQALDAPLITTADVFARMRGRELVVAVRNRLEAAHGEDLLAIVDALEQLEERAR